MKGLYPRPVQPGEGVSWFKSALALITSRPLLFIPSALVPPLGSALLLALPIWNITLPFPGPWIGLLATGLCYGVPLGLGVALACASARAADRETDRPWSRLANRSSLRLVWHGGLFLFALLLQGYLTLFIIDSLLAPAEEMAGLSAPVAPDSGIFGVADTILATQLGMAGGMFLVTQILFSLFAVPLHMFREVPLYVGWQLSFRAIYLSPWIPLAFGLPALLLMILSTSESLAVVAQVLALPMPVLIGVLLYIAWREVFAGRDEAETLRDSGLAF